MTVSRRRATSTKRLANRPGCDAGGNHHSARWFKAVCLVLTLTGLHATLRNAAWCQEETESARGSDENVWTENTWTKGLTRLSPEDAVWVNLKHRYVVLGGTIVLRKGPLEMLACLRRTKEHESIVAVDTKAHVVHTALLAVGAVPGSPVRFYPEYVAASGTPVLVEVAWQDDQRKQHRVDARTWIQDSKSDQTLQSHWVFGGSGFWTDPSSGEQFYHAEGGELICVANFPTATLDLPIESSQSNEHHLFRAYTDRIPPNGTAVYLVLTPMIQ